MKKLLSILLLLALVLSVSAAACAEDNPLARYSDEELRQLYEAVREEMIARGLPLAQEVTLREGKFIVGEDLLPGSYTLKCLSTAGDDFGGVYSALGDAASSLGGEDWGGLFGSLGGMMSEVLNTQVEILGDYGAVLKSFELKAGDSVRVTLTENTALQISDGTCVLIVD